MPATFSTFFYHFISSNKRNIRVEMICKFLQMSVGKPLKRRISSHGSSSVVVVAEITKTKAKVNVKVKGKYGSTSICGDCEGSSAPSRRPVRANMTAHDAEP